MVQTRDVLVEAGKEYRFEATYTPTASSRKSIRDVIELHTNSKKNSPSRSSHCSVSLKQLLQAQVWKVRA